MTKPHGWIYTTLRDVTTFREEQSSSPTIWTRQLGRFNGILR
jgi:hypothetical protein